MNDRILSKAYSVKVILFDHLRNLFLRDIYKKATKLKRLQKSEMKLFMSSKTCLYFIFNMKLCWQRRFLPFLIFLFLISLFTEGLKEHFSKFGDIAEVMVMKDPTTRRSRYEMKLDISYINKLWIKLEIMNKFATVFQYSTNDIKHKFHYSTRKYTFKSPYYQNLDYTCVRFYTIQRCVCHQARLTSRLE